MGIRLPKQTLSDPVRCIYWAISCMHFEGTYYGYPLGISTDLTRSVYKMTEDIYHQIAKSTNVLKKAFFVENFLICWWNADQTHAWKYGAEQDGQSRLPSFEWWRIYGQCYVIAPVTPTHITFKSINFGMIVPCHNSLCRGDGGNLSGVGYPLPL